MFSLCPHGFLLILTTAKKNFSTLPLTITCKWELSSVKEEKNHNFTSLIGATLKLAVSPPAHQRAAFLSHSCHHQAGNRS